MSLPERPRTPLPQFRLRGMVGLFVASYLVAVPVTADEATSRSKDRWITSVSAHEQMGQSDLTAYTCWSDSKTGIHTCATVSRFLAPGTEYLLTITMTITMPVDATEELSPTKSPVVFVDELNISPSKLRSLTFGDLNFYLSPRDYDWIITELDRRGPTTDTSRRIIDALSTGKTLSVKLFFEGGGDVELQMPLTHFWPLLYDSIPCAYQP